jgi:hypothetical protein
MKRSIEEEVYPSSKRKKNIEFMNERLDKIEEDLSKIENKLSNLFKKYFPSKPVEIDVVIQEMEKKFQELNPVIEEIYDRIQKKQFVPTIYFVGLFRPRFEDPSMQTNGIFHWDVINRLFFKDLSLEEIKTRIYFIFVKFLNKSCALMQNNFDTKVLYIKPASIFGIVDNFKKYEQLYYRKFR